MSSMEKREFIKRAWPCIILVLLITLAAIARFYLLEDRLHFNVDEALHSQIIYDIYTKGIFPLQGPASSAEGGVYHGAFYYYVYLIPQIIAGGSPVGPAVFTALLSLFSVLLLFKALKNQYSAKLGILVCAFYCLSASVTFFSRYMWNPNLVPFFFILALYALSILQKEKTWGLVLFGFAVGAISQVHIGAIVIIGVAIMILPYLIIKVKRWDIWGYTLLAFLLAWVPTLINEFQHGFKLFNDLLNPSQPSANLSFIAHFQLGWNYFSNFFETSIKLPSIIFIISLVCSAILFIFYTAWKKPAEALVPLFLLLTIITLFLACSFYNGLLFIHFAEELFVLMPIVAGIFLSFLSEKRWGVLVAIVVLFICGYYNWFVYKKEIIDGERQYKIEREVCSYIQKNKMTEANINFNGKTNPNFVRYVCEREFSIKIGAGKTIDVETDFVNKLNFQIKD